MIKMNHAFGVLVLIAGLLCIYGASACSAAGETVYSNGLEDKSDFGFWCAPGNISGFDKAQASGQLKVNYAGLTDEEYTSEKKSYKLDITLDKCSIAYVILPLATRVPLSAPLYLNGYMKVKAPHADAVIGLGWKVVSPNNKYMDWYVPRAQNCNNNWFLASGNVFDSVKGICSRNESVFGKLGDGSGFFVESLCIHIQSNNKDGFSGQRIVLYLDDVSLTKDSPNITPTGTVDNLENGLSDWLAQSWDKNQQPPVITLIDKNAAEGNSAVVLSFTGDRTVAFKSWPKVKDWQKMTLFTKKISGLGQCQIYLVERIDGKDEWFRSPVLSLGPVWQKVSMNYSDFKYAWGPDTGDKTLDKSKINRFVFMPAPSSKEIEFAVDDIKVE